MNFPHAYWSQPWQYPKIDYCSVCTSNPMQLGCPSNPLVININWDWVANACSYWLWGHGSTLVNGWYHCSSCWNEALVMSINIGQSLNLVDSFIYKALRIIPYDCLVVKIRFPNGTFSIFQLSKSSIFDLRAYIIQYTYDFIRIA